MERITEMFWWCVDSVKGLVLNFLAAGPNTKSFLYLTTTKTTKTIPATDSDEGIAHRVKRRRGRPRKVIVSDVSSGEETETPGNQKRNRSTASSVKTRKKRAGVSKTT
ncbi:hypothetical protein Dda_8741 [Drechslerella dactyloides]|uniref:Uncharacterized protein n=1 Tax=Drechslerella dactyloides TaxID=74499 RepID=A0AAD6NEZ4_DREDA|nr:hypothetical protein Dda_8741 [Drechslerella dactyloides]